MTLLMVRISLACLSVQVYSDILGSLQFDMLATVPEESSSNGKKGNLGRAYKSSGRQVYQSTSESEVQKTHYLYHIEADAEKGEGRWVVSTEFNAFDHAVAFVESWAVTPFGTESLKDKVGAREGWKVARKPLKATSQVEAKKQLKENYFSHDKSFKVMCRDVDGHEDRSVYFDASADMRPELAGFYVETAIHTQPEFKGKGLPSVYAQIIPNVAAGQRSTPFYLYSLGDGETWMIGETPYVDSGLAFVKEAGIASADTISSHKWKYVGDSSSGFAWQGAEGTIVKRNMTYTLSHGRPSSEGGDGGVRHEVRHVESGDIHDALQSYRSIKYVPRPQKYAVLRNGLPMPYVGLGTGGLFLEEVKSVVKQAIRAGYRLIDTAREYGNERLCAEAIEEMSEFDADHSAFNRRDMFVASKVWPTQLGVTPTRRAVVKSLHELKTNYIDMYLLHWPFCDKRIDWHHCQDVEEVAGTWKHSWKALEREYAEGRVMSIGVSNFDVELLTELTALSTIDPHLIQNHAEVGEAAQDRQVREWCRDHRVLYQPYAHQRNLQYLSRDLQEVLDQVSHMHKRSRHVVASRFFLQTGASIIPRSRDIAHLAENIDLFGWELQHADMRELGWQHENEDWGISSEQVRESQTARGRPEL